MKRFMSMVLAAIMVLTLVACGGGEKQSAPDEENPGKVETSSSEKMDSTGVAKDDVEEIQFEEITVVDNEQCVIKITGIDPDNVWGYTLKAYMENKSTDKTYMYAVSTASVNGVQADPGFATEIAAGKKANGEISFSTSTISPDVIGEFSDIELSFRVYDSNDWAADNVAEETVHVYPFGKDKASTFVRKAQSTDTVLVDNDEVSVIVTDYDEDGFWGYTVNLYLVNKTNKELTYSVDEASINGFMADPFWATSISPEKVSFASMSWSDSDFESNGITDVEEIEMRFKIYSSDDWAADDIFNDVITLNP